MSLTKRKLLDDLNAELERHANCKIKDTISQDDLTGVWFISGRCETHNEEVSHDFMRYYLGLE